jgi:hypothetical protein
MRWLCAKRSLGLMLHKRVFLKDEDSLPAVRARIGGSLITRDRLLPHLSVHTDGYRREAVSKTPDFDTATGG